jgi:hypothetical protein
VRLPTLNAEQASEKARPPIALAQDSFDRSKTRCAIFFSIRYGNAHAPTYSEPAVVIEIIPEAAPSL